MAPGLVSSENVELLLLSRSGRGSASALRQINRLLQENKAVVPAAVGGGTVLGTAAILSRNKGKGKS